ncbi:hypothetical protein ACFL2Q_04955 [Thermodesulfobacteriota bacterium]
MNETITILAGILAVLVMLDHFRHMRNESEAGRIPVFDTLDMFLFITSLAVLMTIAAGLIAEGSSLRAIPK